MSSSSGTAVGASLPAGTGCEVDAGTTKVGYSPADGHVGELFEQYDFTSQDRLGGGGLLHIPFRGDKVETDAENTQGQR